MISLCNEIGFEETIATKFLNFLLNESVKVQSTNKQTHLSIFLKAKITRTRRKKIIHMEVGEPDFLPPQIVKDALNEVFDKGFLKYGQAKECLLLERYLQNMLQKNLIKIFLKKISL